MLLVDCYWYAPIGAQACRTASTSMYMRPGSHLAHITGQSDPSDKPAKTPTVPGDGPGLSSGGLWPTVIALRTCTTATEGAARR
jgi:hypothetical protein